MKGDWIKTQSMWQETKRKKQKRKQGEGDRENENKMGGEKRDFCFKKHKYTKQIQQKGEQTIR